MAKTRSKPTIMREIIRVQNRLNESRHYSNCMIYAGAGCDCSYGELESQLKSVQQELEERSKPVEHD